MAEYTDFFDHMSMNILDADNYFEELKHAVKLFRTFDAALDTFIAEHGYSGDISNVEEKVAFITERFKTAGVPVPRNIRKWYSEHKRIERETAFQICFAFGQDFDETEDFLRRICLSRKFDCHSEKEVVYCYAFKRGWSYQETMEVLSQIGETEVVRIPQEDIIYTKFIAEELEEIQTKEDLISYLNQNKDRFEYNSATAYDTIRAFWQAISKPDGLAIREKKQLYMAFDRETGLEEEQENQTEEHSGKKRKERKRVDNSIWEIYLQILGLSGNCSADFYKGRSLKLLLKDSELLHSLAEDCFPDRDGLNKILNGEHVSYERVRKMLILLGFYKFWAEKAVNIHSYEAGYEDADRCIEYLNHILVDAGYQILYPGNPYDFILLVAVNAEFPLYTFREYMREMFYERT